MRTTVDIDLPILNDLKRLQKREGKSLGRLMSDLLAEALGSRRARTEITPPVTWHTTRGKILVDLADKEHVYEILDAESVRASRR